MAHKAGDTIQIKGVTYVYGVNEELTLLSAVEPTPVKDNKVLAELKKKANISEVQPISVAELPLGTGAATEAKQNEIIDIITTNLTLRLIESGVYTYVGEAIIGSDESDPVWKVKRIDEASGVIILWADGNENFDNVWSNYASLVYN